MTARRIFCEGPDDHAALREIIRRRFGRRVAAVQQPDLKGSRLSREGAEDVVLIYTMSRDKLLPAVDKILGNDSPSSPTRVIGLSFDPDDDEEPVWQSWIERRLARWKPHRHDDGWTLDRDLGPVDLVPLPWVSAREARTGLPATQSIDRLLTDVLASKHPALGALVDRWLGEAEEHGRPPNWKMAVRFWNGLVAADVSGPSFFDKAFGQDKDLRDSVDTVLRDSQMWRGLERVCEGPVVPTTPQAQREP